MKFKLDGDAVDLYFKDDDALIATENEGYDGFARGADLGKLIDDFRRDRDWKKTVTRRTIGEFSTFKEALALIPEGYELVSTDEFHERLKR